MNRSLDVDLVLREFYADDGLPAPDRVLNAVEDRIGQQRQRRNWRLRGRPFMNTYAKLAAAAAAIVIVAVVGYNLLSRPSSIGTPSNVPSTAPPGATSTPGTINAADLLAGRWTSAQSTCADQNAALQRSGFTAAQLALGGWDAATCMQMTHGKTHVIQFLESHVIPEPSGANANGTLIQYADGAIGWEGYWVVVDADTFMAGDGGHAPYLTYQFTITGDQLVIDMVDNKFPAETEAGLLGDSIAQTVIYESLPFIRVQ